MRIAVDQDALARMVARHVTMHHDTTVSAARRLADATPNAADDASGLTIATRMQAQAAGVVAASHNVQDGISLMQIADGALASMTAYLQQVRVIALQAANDTFGAEQRSGLQVGVNTLLDGFDDTWRSISDGVRTIQVGADAGETMSLPTLDQAERAWAVSVRDPESAKSALDVLDEALEELYAHRAAAGAAENRLRRILTTLGVEGDTAHVTAARITDADLGREVVRLLQSRTWAQAGGQMLAEVQRAGRRALDLLLESAIEPPAESVRPAGQSSADAASAEPPSPGATVMISPPAPVLAPASSPASSPAPPPAPVGETTRTDAVPEAPPVDPRDELPWAARESADRTRTEHTHAP
ncbi:flagellin N-terminal helical domain-containing protein [Mobilicoccus massiliensis]|uniref:flagellin N-terminal helical domain-containing protein n=1 Tax=Mobilicoccus massiliensis TaxID=1522310 RepID=UPI001596E7B5|nr:flagellin [Mobilicoccus massiliensis]